MFRLCYLFFPFLISAAENENLDIGNNHHSCINKMGTLFRLFDADNSGYLSEIVELEPVIFIWSNMDFICSGSIVKFIRMILKLKDKNEDGELTFEEMVKGTFQSLDIPKSLFGELDLNGDSKVSLAELYTLTRIVHLKKLCQFYDSKEFAVKDFNSTMNIMDVDRDGKINRKEFSSFFCKATYFKRTFGN